LAPRADLSSIGIAAQARPLRKALARANSLVLLVTIEDESLQPLQGPPRNMRDSDVGADVIPAPPSAARPLALCPKETMRLLFLSAITLLAGGCAALHHLDDYTVAEGASGSSGSSPNAPAPSTSSTSGTTPSSTQATACTSNRACMEHGTLANGLGVPSPPSVCVKATGKCTPLTTTECPRFVGDPANDDALVLGTLLGAADGSASVLEQAAVLAAEEINAARPLVVVGCNPADDVLKATRHLVEALRVPAIIGPVAGEDVVSATQQVSAKGGTLVMTPTSPVSSISNLADDDLTWRAVPSDAQRAKLVIEQINELETLLRTTRRLTNIKLGIVHPSDALGVSARDSISTKLILNSRFISDAANAGFVSVDGYPKGDKDAQGSIAANYAATFKPDIVFLTSAEQIDDLVLPLEQALTIARVVDRPYYLLGDAGKTEALLERIAGTGLPADIKRRIRGVGVKPDSMSAPILAEFSAAFASRHGAEPTLSVLPSAAASYDAMYAIAYAIAATPEMALSGPRVAQGLRTLAVGDAVTVGGKSVAAVVQQLAFHQSVSLRGTFGPMQWDASGDIRAGTLEVWCVGMKDGAPSFGSSGLTMDVQTQVIGGAFVQCQ
jgi:ABC-type branched-subunit amino acid transport system substrate-binding protein